MKRKRVDSSSLRSVGYNRERELLEVEFHTGAVYLYAGVSERVYAELLAASSLGAFFNANIRDQYLMSQIT